MNYIKDLYIAKPTLVKRAIMKLFNIKKLENVIEVNPDEDILSENDIMFKLIDEKNGSAVDVVFEDFAICYDKYYLNLDDGRLQEYLNFMARIYKNKYLQGFHDYRKVECNELVSVFNARTYAMEAKLADAINKIEKKETNKTL